jgi:tRNA 2-thiouridine synthesizing protein D|tara:strand:- start:497 stop:871 length:375 start_codon:yes stop_codon:yes gene_type:complete
MKGEKMKFGILIKEGPYTHQASDSAYQFTLAALEKGHEIEGVFFYNDGVINATRHMDPPQDDRHLSKLWSELGRKTGQDWMVCIAAAKRRGIVETEIAPNMSITGLGELTDLTIRADRMITFGD